VTAGTAALLLFVGCGSSNGSDKPIVVATTTQIGDFARAVGGDAVDVHQILRPNTDPHEYEPRPDDVRATADAKVVFVNGDGLDSWMGDVVKQAGGSRNVVTLGDVARTHLPGEAEGPEASPVDPHWWHDPRNAEAAVERVRSALGEALPADKEAFDRRAAAYVGEIAALDKRLGRCFASVPAAERKLVTSHDAFGYLAKRYGIDVVGAIVPSQSTEAQPSAGDIARLVDQVRSEKVRAIFIENSVNPKLGEAVANQTGTIGNLRLYGDTLGPKGSAGATYLGMELANANAMMRGFTGGQRGCR
jgi:ABC-type Zn uptake system ZnuABC Zn-binding protein ZnuA